MNRETLNHSVFKNKVFLRNDPSKIFEVAHRIGCIWIKYIDDNLDIQEEYIEYENGEFYICGRKPLLHAFVNNLVLEGEMIQWNYL